MIELIGNNHESSIKNSLNNRFNVLKSYMDLGVIIEKFWMDKKNRKTRNWINHQDINTVMLATTFAPQGFLKI